MINIDHKRATLSCSIHIKELRPKIIARIKNRKASDKRALTKAQFTKLETHMVPLINDILGGKRSKLVRVNNDILAMFNANNRQIKNLQNDLTFIYNYKWYRSCVGYNGFDLFENLNNSTCPYCNRNQATQLNIANPSKKIYPAFDHYLPLSKYPLLGISLYNLVPCCELCNSRSYKGNLDPEIRNDIFYPYVDYTSAKEYYFDFRPKNLGAFSRKKGSFKLVPRTRLNPLRGNPIVDSINFFDLPEIYVANHEDLILEIIQRTRAYSKSYLLTLQAAYKLSFNDAYRMVYETYYVDNEMNRRSLSKLKKDLYNHFH